MYIRRFDEKSPFVYSSDFLFDETLTDLSIPGLANNANGLLAGTPQLYFSDKHYL